MALYQNRIGVVSQSIDDIDVLKRKRVFASPIANSFLPKEEEFIQPYQVKNNTLYSKPRPTGGFENPKKYNYVPLNQKPEDCVNEFNAPLYYPPKLEQSVVSNKFMLSSKMKKDEYEPHQMAKTLEQMIRVH